MRERKTPPLKPFGFHTVYVLFIFKGKASKKQTRDYAEAREQIELKLNGP